MSSRILVVNPVGSPATRDLHAANQAPARTNVRGMGLRTVVVIENGKPNAGALLDGVARELASEMDLRVLTRLRKPNPSMAAPPEMIESASGADLILIGTAD